MFFFFHLYLQKSTFSRKNCWSPIKILLFNPLELYWHPAVINSAEELEFIQRNQKNLSNTQDFFIGGSSNSTGIISDFSNYLPNQSGKNNIVHIPVQQRKKTVQLWTQLPVTLYVCVLKREYIGVVVWLSDIDYFSSKKQKTNL